MDFENVPAYWFVVATLLPLASFVLIFLASGLWCVARRYQNAPGMEQLYQITGGDKPGPTGAYAALEVGYSIDSLAALMFVMVTFVASLIHLFSMGYMKEEKDEIVEDHHVYGHHYHAVGEHHGDPVHHQTEHYKRRGRFGRFFMYLSLFCFSMLNLVLASNLFQVFISWELVGICSYLLVGFYFERTSASN